MNTENDPDAPLKPRRLHRTLLVLGLLGGTIGLCSGLSFLFQHIGPLLRADVHSQSNLKLISLSVHTCDSTFDHMPGPFLDSEASPGAVIPENPADRLSWRVSILPFLEKGSLFSNFNHSEAWNSPANRPHSATFIAFYYTAPGDDATWTAYRVFYDNGALWDSDPKRRIKFDKIPDGAANTILIAESTVQVPWAQFNEHPYSPTGPLPALGHPNRDTFLAAMADGSVRVVKKSVSANTLRAAITRAGGESLGPDW